ncbi:acyl-CoA thioesterase [Tomitella gaofuii]|uniref:acyl-CoA thioesterase n=1 Tax=Tomitella gaofuii TaxID=2760083 RepID=UPI0015FCFB9C|nr:thioesterase family protein [Tomitella gaofuii]
MTNSSAASHAPRPGGSVGAGTPGAVADGTGSGDSAVDVIARAAREGLPTVTIRRQLQWPDTDASGHQHFSVVRQWAEEAEGEFLESIARPELLKHLPRVRYEADFRQRMWLRENLEVRFAVVAVGASSVTYRFAIIGARGTAADGTMIAVHTDGSEGGPVPWPDDLRAAFTGSLPPAI